MKGGLKKMHEHNSCLKYKFTTCEMVREIAMHYEISYSKREPLGYLSCRNNFNLNKEDKNTSYKGD